jgi:RHS repeat-associated protein
VQQVTTTGPAGSRSDAYTYDGTGNTATRSLAGTGETLTWDSEGHLASHTRAGQTTSFVYDADGARLIRREPTAVTLYLDNAEVRLDTTANTVAGTRYYVFNGATVAVRTSAGLRLLVSTHQGSAELAVDGTTGAVTRRRFSPFGQPRGASPGWPGQRGFVGGTTDPTTGLTHLGAREYDPGIGRFLSVDPLLSDGDPQQAQGYAYANNSPVTFSDPTGLEPCSWCSTGQEEADTAKRRAAGGSSGGTGSGGGGGGGGTSRGGGGGGGGDRSWSDQPTSSSSSGEAAAAAKLAALVAARAAREAQKQRLIRAAKALVKIAADELGITAGLDCLTKGNLGACAETAVNVISSFAGGVAGKLMAKYGLPWKWAKGAKLVKSLWRIGGEALDAMKGWFKAGKELKQAEHAANSVDDVPDALVLARGGTNTPERFSVGSGVTTDANGTLSGVSVNSGTTIEDAARGIPHTQIGVTTAGDVRRAGGSVTRDPLPDNPGHCLVSGCTAETFSDLFTPTIKNPGL